ncbi:MAG: hypothetical protein ACM3MG_02975 [Bacillota bacterium]
MTKIFFAALFISLSPLAVFAHGDEKPGPHGGHVRMPGSFHTEMEIDSVQGAHIYLLDINFNNPTIKDSSVEAKFYPKDKSPVVAYKCGLMGGDHFHCIPQGKIQGAGQLKIKAVRENIIGNEVIYDLPLKPFADSEDSKPIDHSTH